MAQQDVVAVPENAKSIPAITVLPQTQSVVVLVGVASNVVLFLVSLTNSRRSHALRTFGNYSHHLASAQELAQVLFLKYGLSR